MHVVSLRVYFEDAFLRGGSLLRRWNRHCAGAGGGPPSVVRQNMATPLVLSFVMCARARVRETHTFPGPETQLYISNGLCILVVEGGVSVGGKKGASDKGGLAWGGTRGQAPVLSVRSVRSVGVGVLGCRRACLPWQVACPWRAQVCCWPSRLMAPPVLEPLTFRRKNNSSGSRRGRNWDCGRTCARGCLAVAYCLCGLEVDHTYRPYVKGQIEPGLGSFPNLLRLDRRRRVEIIVTLVL